MLSEKKHTCSAKIWIEYLGKPLIGPGSAMILQGISEEKSISKTAKKLGMSYRYVWDHIQTIQKTLGKPIVTTYKGGKIGGGGAILNELGSDLLAEYRLIQDHLHAALEAESGEGAVPEKSKPDRLKGRVLSVEKERIDWKVRIEIGQGSVITALMGNEAIKELGLKAGDPVEAMVKTSEILIAK